MDIALNNGLVFLDNKFQAKNIGIKNGIIAEISDHAIKATEEIDFSAKHIFPGFIDTQVHFREPGLTHKEDIESGSRAAAAGGITAFMEMPNTSPPTTSEIAIIEKINIAKEKSYTDFAFFVGATKENIGELDNISKIDGCCGIKIFMGSSTGSLLLSEEDEILKLLKSTNSTVSVHSEDEDLLQKNIHIRDNAKSCHDHLLWRNEEVAFRCTQKIISIAQKAGRKVHVLHITSAKEIDFLINNLEHCSFEITPQHLSLTAPQCYDELGSYAQMNPPIRTIEHQEKLWTAVNDGYAYIIASDHAPHTKEEKDKAYPHSPSGMPGVQTIACIMLDHVLNGKMTFERLVELLCYNPAKLFNLKNKGAIQIGRDADFSIFKFQENTITNDWIESKCKWTPFNNKKVKAWPTDTIIRGQFAFKNQKLQKISANALSQEK